MKAPANMTSDQVMNTINTIINRICPKYTFYGYDLDDIKQEAFIICYEALDRYDEKRPLENFLSVNLSNRLKNFVRDHNFTKSSEVKKKVLSPKHLTVEDLVFDESAQCKDYSEMTNIIDEFLPNSMRSDYLKIINNVYVNKKRREEVLLEIKQILEDNGYA